MHAPYPLRDDAHPRAVWPDGCKHLVVHGWHPDDVAEFQAIVDRLKAKRAALRAAQAPATVVPARDLTELHADLQDARAGFDPEYMHSEDRTFVSVQREKASRIAGLERLMAQAVA